MELKKYIDKLMASKDKTKYEAIVYLTEIEDCEDEEVGEEISD